MFAPNVLSDVEVALRQSPSLGNRDASWFARLWRSWEKVKSHSLYVPSSTPRSRTKKQPAPDTMSATA